MISGIMEQDIETFDMAINGIPHIGFKNIEVKMMSSLVPNLLTLMDTAGSYSSGMSSFGPTVFGLTDSEKKAEDIKKTVCDYLSDLDIECQSWISKPNNSGVLIS